MPRRPARTCTRPGCYEASSDGSTCVAHAAQDAETVEARRPTAAERGYDAKWARNRARFLVAHPTCSVPGCGEAATVADHAPKTRAELIAAGEQHPDAWCHLQPLCASHHSAKTARTDGGFGNRKLSGL